MYGLGGVWRNTKRDRVRPHAAAAERRAAALDVNVDRMLIGASLRATKQLRATWPRFSAATLGWRSRAAPLLLLALAFAAMLNASSTVALSVLVVLPAAFRIWIVVHPTMSSPDELADTQDEQEPVYSVIVPLRGEARVVDQLLSAIERLNYPHEKLDVIIAVEAEDHATRAAITARKHRIPIMIVPVPAVGPGTKPKALNVALPFARGTFTVIYDAEDRPERNQLRAALKAFQSGGGDLACVQAHLCIDTKTSWLARYFTAEYAGHFDVFLPKLAALGLPLPLGGSSNHFRTAALREVGGWDPHNVTEDADLGMRLARFGLRSRRGRHPALTKRLQQILVAGSASGHAGSKAGCKRGLSICANRTGFSASLALAVFSPFNSSSAAMRWSPWCIPFSCCG